MRTTQLSNQTFQSNITTNLTSRLDSRQCHFFISSTHLSRYCTYLRCYMIRTQPIQDICLHRSIRLALQHLGYRSIPSLIGNAFRQSQGIYTICTIITLYCCRHQRKRFFACYGYNNVQGSTLYMALVCCFQQSLGSSTCFLATAFAYQLLKQTQISRRSIAGFPFITHILGSLTQYRDRQRSAALCQRLVNGSSSRCIRSLQPSQQNRFSRSHLFQTGSMSQSSFRSRFFLHQVKQYFFCSLDSSQTTNGPFRQILIVQIFYEYRSIFRFTAHSQQSQQESLVRIILTSIQSLNQSLTDDCFFSLLTRSGNVCHYPIQGIFHNRILSFTGRHQHIRYLRYSFSTGRNQFAHHLIEHLLLRSRKLVQCIGDNRFRCTHTGILCHSTPR